MSAATWLITGASSRLGYALAEHVLKQHDQVVLAARTMHSMQALATSFPNTALAVQLDVTSPEHRANVVRQTETRFGSIDVLVNNACIDYPGAIEDRKSATMGKYSRSTSSVPSRFLRLVLPGMRQRGRGTIVNSFAPRSGRDRQAHARHANQARVDARGRRSKVATIGRCSRIAWRWASMMMGYRWRRGTSSSVSPG